MWKYVAIQNKLTYPCFGIFIKDLLNTKPFEFRIIFRSAPCSTKDEIHHLVKFGSVRNSARQVFLHFIFKMLNPDVHYRGNGVNIFFLFFHPIKDGKL
jgi:hypothetical protein